jgi:hypothetical protein
MQDHKKRIGADVSCTSTGGRQAGLCSLTIKHGLSWQRFLLKADLACLTLDSKSTFIFQTALSGGHHQSCLYTRKYPWGRNHADFFAIWDTTGKEMYEKK